MQRFNDVLFEHATSGLALCRMDGTMVRVNSVYAQILGRSISETLGLAYWQITPESYAKQEAAQLKSLEDLGHYGPYDKEYIHADGHLVPVRLSGRIVEFGGERLIWSSVEDITERKRLMDASEAARREAMMAYELLDKVFDRVNDGIVALDNNWCYTYVNARAARMLQREKPEDLIGKHIWTEYPQGIDQPFYQAYLKAAQTQHAVVFDDYYEPWDLWFENRVYPSPDGLTIYFTEVTERKRAERSLRESEERFRLAASGGDVWGWDIDANKLQFPQEFWQKLGYDGLEVDDALHMFESVIHPDDRASWQKALKDHIGRRLPYDLDYRARTKSGEYRWFHTSGQARWDDAGRALYMAGTTFDISERKQAELELKQSEDRFRLAASTGDVWGWDIVTNQYSFSPEFWRKLGYQDTDIVEPLQMFETILHPDDNAGWRQALREHLRGHLPYRMDLRFRTTQGEYRWFHTRGQARWDVDGRAVYMAGTTFDITERKHAEAQIQQLNIDLEKRVAERTAELAAANRELETFAYSVSHDLKAPLRGIDGYSQLLQETCASELSEDGRLFVQNIRDGSAQMNALIDDLLDYSRMERRHLRSMRLDLGDAVRSVLAERASEIEARGVSLQVQFPALSVQADPDGLAVALRNLFENALKFTNGAKPPVIEVGGREEPDSCILWVKDNGIGFDMKFHDRIFEIFQRLQRTEDYPGTGIGLALVSKAMQRMGGRVWAQSAPGQGATFYLELPK
jgi:PAS domain S-box-containing protein